MAADLHERRLGRDVAEDGLVVRREIEEAGAVWFHGVGYIEETISRLGAEGSLAALKTDDDVGQRKLSRGT